MLGFLMPGILAAADLGLKNGDFTTGKQFWRGDGTVVTLPDGNKVIEMVSNPRRQDQVYQEIEMGTLTQVEVRFRARFIGGKGQMRAKLMKKNGGSTLFAFDLPPDGEWRDISFKHVRENLRDERSLVLETLPYEGKLQIDDVWSGEPGTHTSERPMVPTSAPPKPTTPVTMPAVVPTPVAVPAASPAGAALETVVDALPAAIRAKLMTPEITPAVVDEVNAYFATELIGKPLQVSLVVHTAELVPSGQNKLRLRASDGLLSGRHPGLRQHMLWAYFPAATAPDLSQLPMGAGVTIIGTISRCDVKSGPGGARLNLDLQSARLAGSPAASPAAAMPSAAPASSTTRQMNPDVPLTPLQQSISHGIADTAGTPGTFQPQHERISSELIRHDWLWAPTQNYSAMISFRENGDVLHKESKEVNGDWQISQDGTVVYRRGDDRSLIWLLRVAGPGRFEGVGAGGAVKGRSATMTRQADLAAVLAKFEGTEWAWGSGGTLRLDQQGVAVHSAWKSAGTWVAMDENTLFVKRPANDPPMIVTFDAERTSGTVVSHIPSSTTLKRLK